MIYSSKYIHNLLQCDRCSYQVQVQEIFRIQREGEADHFDKVAKSRHRHGLASSRTFLGQGIENPGHPDADDRRLLWHGSRCTNFGGILSQGLRIAPPEAPVSGYAFGKGLYFGTYHLPFSHWNGWLM